VVACAAAIAGDNMQDLKAGQIVGATPVKQQIMQVIGVVAAALVIGPVLSVLFNAYGLADVLPRPDMDPAEALRAPQADLMRSVAIGVLRLDLPWTLIAIGAGLAVAIIALDEFLRARGSAFRTPVLAVAVGIYLPVELSVPILVGGVAAHLARRGLVREGASAEQLAHAGRRGLLFASGLITGEALVGIVLAVPFAIAQSTQVLALPFLPEGWESGGGTVLGLLLFAGFVVWQYRVARQRPA
jgi:putative OPT family oligopeptide transporter